MHKRILAVLLALVILIFCFPPAAQAAQPEAVNWTTLKLCFGTPDSAAFTQPQKCNGKWTLFLPAGGQTSASVFCTLPADVASVTAENKSGARCELRSGAATGLEALLGGSVSELTLRAKLAAGGTQTAEMTVYCSDTVDALFFSSSDPVNCGRLWVEASPSKENKAGGAMVLLKDDGSLTHADSVEAIKGRGNATWEQVKKPYQMKLAKKDDLLDTGDGNNKAKKWLLIANYLDQSLLRNRIALGLGHALGMEFNIEFKPIDLYYDGEYRGSYLLTEKVEIGKGRVNIYDLEAENESVNPGVSLETLPVQSGKTESGANYRYCEGMKTPADYKSGYLLEMEMSYRLQDEVCWVQTRRGYNIVVKSPEYCSREEMEYLANWYQGYEDACFNDDGTDPASGRRYTDFIDLKSTVQCYLVSELSKNSDAFQSSSYIYIDSEDAPAKMGPLWDFDCSFGRDISEAEKKGSLRFQCEPTGFFHLHNIIVNNWYQQADFRREVCAQFSGMYDLVQEILLGGEDRAEGYLMSISGMRRQTAASRLCDEALWSGTRKWAAKEAAVDQLRSYIALRVKDLKERFAQWEASPPEIGMFLDVPNTAWYAKEVTEAVKYGIIHGISQVFYEPNGSASRRNFVQMLYNMASPGTLEGSTPFTDVSSSPPISWAASQGITNGYPDGSFRPNNSITRAELVTLLHRMYGEPVAEGDTLSRFPDANKVPAYARSAMKWAVQAGIIRGNSDGTLQPGAKASRAELAAILLRAIHWQEAKP